MSVDINSNSPLYKQDRFFMCAFCQRRMVTHHWSNRFCDLVAAVISDALGLKRWDLISEKLRSRRGGGEFEWKQWRNQFVESTCETKKLQVQN